MSSRGSPRLSATSATSGSSSIGSRRGAASSARPKRSVSLQNAMARSSEAMSFGAKRCTVGSGLRCQPVGQELRVRQHVAQVVIDLAHGQAERREPALLVQQLGQLGLHVRQLALGRADLVAARRWGDDAAGVLRVSR